MLDGACTTGSRAFVVSKVIEKTKLIAYEGPLHFCRREEASCLINKSDPADICT